MTHSALSDATFAFIGWNPFQLKHFLSIAQKTPNATMLIEKRQNHIYSFETELLTDTGLPTVIWPKDHIEQLDGVFDVFVCQTPFSKMDQIRNSAVAMMQYGYAKAPHNYGSWRSKAELCMVYGSYAADRIRPLCPTEITGNPAMDPWHDPQFHRLAEQKLATRLEPGRKTVLYAPTWGELSTLPQYMEAVLELADEFNVLIKLHHNTELLSRRFSRPMKSTTAHMFGANDSLLELLCVSDIVLSDYSGAIFDALYCERPAVLLHYQTENRVGAKLDLESLEYSQRHRIGPVLEDPRMLRATLRGILNGHIDYRRLNQELTSELYLPGPGSAQRAASALQRHFQRNHQ